MSFPIKMYTIKETCKNDYKTCMVLNRKLDTLKMNIKLQNKINNRWKNMPL